METQSTEIVPVFSEIPATAEMFLPTNIDNKIRLLGVAKCSIRNNRHEPYREGFLVICQ